MLKAARASLTGITLASFANARGGSYDGIGMAGGLKSGLAGGTPSIAKFFGGPFDGSDATLAVADVPLAVNFASLTATAVRLRVALRWRTAPPSDAASFLVERYSVHGAGVDGEIWMSVARVSAVGSGLESHEYHVTDHISSAQRSTYRVSALDAAGAVSSSRTVEVEVGLAPLSLALDQNYPNPFNPTTTVEFTFPSAGDGSVRIFDLLGRTVATIFDTSVLPGRYYQAVFDGSSLASGSYFCRLEFNSEGTTKTILRRMVLVR